MALTEMQVKAAITRAKSYKMSDNAGLFLLVHTNGSKYWRYKYRHNGTEKTLALGVYPQVKLSDARKKHADARMLLSGGVDPSGAKVQAKHLAKLSAAQSFEAIALEWIESRRNGWTEKYAAKVRKQLEQHAFKRIGSKAIAEITAPELLSLVRKIEEKGTLETAHRVKQTCGQIFTYAIATGRAERNPANDITGALKVPKKKHNPHLEPKQLPEFLQKLSEYQGDNQTKLAITLVLLTGVRTTELRGATWEEIDFEKCEWRVPAARMKMRQPHIVPLSKQAIAIFHEMQQLTGNMPYVCSNRACPRKFMSENTMLFALYRMGYHGRLTIHGLRGTLSTILNEEGFNRDHIERQLAHAARDEVRASYNHTDYLPHRTKMMQWWADYLVTQGLKL